MENAFDYIYDNIPIYGGEVVCFPFCKGCCESELEVKESQLIGEDTVIVSRTLQCKHINKCKALAKKFSTGGKDIRT